MHHGMIYDSAHDVDQQMMNIFHMLNGKVGFIAPLDYFQPFEDGPYTLVGRILGQCARLARKEGDLDRFYPWMEELIGLLGPERALVMFGKAVYGRGTDEPSDVDALVFIGQDGSDDREKTTRMMSISARAVVPGNALHGQQIISSENRFGLGGWTTLCVANGLVFLPMELSPEIIDAIGRARAEFLARDFFSRNSLELGGIGELITYAMTKILEGREEKYLDSGQVSILDKFSEKIEATVRRKLYKAERPEPAKADPDFNPGALSGARKNDSVIPPDYEYQAVVENRQKRFIKTDGGGELLSPSDFNMESRERIRHEFEDQEIVALAKAAMRRIRVKKEHRDPLAKRFVGELPKKRAAFSYY